MGRWLIDPRLTDTIRENHGDCKMAENVSNPNNLLRSVRPFRQLREQEILRVAANLPAEDSLSALKIAKTHVLRWAQNKSIGSLPPEAWEFRDFERLTSGRNCSAVHLEADDKDIWALRVEDPDKGVAGRTWTSEITISSGEGFPQPRFTLRLLVGTSEPFLAIEPHVPGVVRQIISSPGLLAGAYKLTDKPLLIKSDHAAGILIDALLDPARKLPIIAISVPADSTDPLSPLLDPKILAEACAGLAIVVVVTSESSWALTERFGKQLSVYEGAARVYLPGFTEDANPFGGHELLLPQNFSSPGAVVAALTRLRWIAANGSVRRLQLGKDVLAFAALKSQALQKRQLALQNVGATDQEQLEAANERIGLLETQLLESRNYEQQFSDLHQDAEQRAETSETQLRAATFRIQQLLDQLETSGVTPDAKIVLPEEWQDFANWCDLNLAGRVILSPQARRSLRSAVYEDIGLAARCLLWLANEFRVAKTKETDGSLRDASIEAGVVNAHCGADSYEIEWQGKKHQVEWHIKNGGNTRDPVRCLRLYYFWDDTALQSVIAAMPAHRRTDAS